MIFSLSNNPLELSSECSSCEVNNVFRTASLCVKKPTYKDRVSSCSLRCIDNALVERGALSCRKARNGTFFFSTCAAEPHKQDATPIHLDTGSVVRSPAGKLDHPGFPAHSVELSPLCDEVGWSVHLRNVTSVHDDHSVKRQERKKGRWDFRAIIYFFTPDQTFICFMKLWVVGMSRPMTCDLYSIHD